MSNSSQPVQTEELPWEDPLTTVERATFYRGLTEEVHRASKKRSEYIDLTEALRRALSYYYGEFTSLIPDTSQMTIYTLIKAARKGDSRVVEMIKESTDAAIEEFFKSLRAYATKIARRGLGRKLQDRGRCESVEELDQPLQDRHDPPNGHVFTEETRQTVRDVMMRADPRDGQICWVFHVEEKSYAEIAESCGRTPAAVKQARFRFAKELRGELWKTHEECKSK